MYIVTLIVSFTGKYGGFGAYAFLAPDLFVIKDFGGQVPYLIKCEGQIQRLIAPIFLHLGFLHIFVSFCMRKMIRLVQYDQSDDPRIHA